jgi:hypothetical protein
LRPSAYAGKTTGNSNAIFRLHQGHKKLMQSVWIILKKRLTSR